MKHCLVFLASLFLAFVAISSASTASPADWARVAPAVSAGSMAPASGGGDQSSWMTVPAPGIAAFVLIAAF